MKTLLAITFALALLTENAQAHWATSFAMSAEYGDLVSASGDPTCTTTFKNLVEELKKIPPVTRTYGGYNGSLACGEERGSIAPYGGSFQIGFRDQAYQHYFYDRIFSGAVLDPIGRADVFGKPAPGAESCHLVYEVRFIFSDPRS